MTGDERSSWKLDRGATALGPSRTQFRVWAPRARSLAVQLLGREPQAIPMDRDADGLFSGVSPTGPGQEYRYLLDDGSARPDPVSRWQPRGVHGPSGVVDPELYAWDDSTWTGLPLKDYCLYELHVGTFTAEGTFEAAIGKLPHLRDLGITAVELMPVAEFPGGRNWGYDGVFPYAPQSTYGGPVGLKRLVNACHAHGLAAVLDVVYNHLGPEGNVLPAFGPYLTRRHRTPWGEAINFDGPHCREVRRYFIDNARYWFAEYHVDALRLDAVQTIHDRSDHHFLAELGEACRDLTAQLDRPCHLIAESDQNDVQLLRPRARGGIGMDAQWSDDLHRSLHALLTGQRQGYFVDFGEPAHLAKAYTDGFVIDGRYSRYYQRHHGTSSADRPGEQHVVYLQNHDQVANAGQGARLATQIDPARLRLGAVALLCAPNLPLLFMGEEYGETHPFEYFISHTDPTLIRSVRQGRQREHARLRFDRPTGDQTPSNPPRGDQTPGDRSVGDPSSGDLRVPDPQSPDTFERCRLDWSRLEGEPHRALLRCYRQLLSLRCQSPALRNGRKDLCRVAFRGSPPWIALWRGDPSGAAALLLLNFADVPQEVPLGEVAPPSSSLAPPQQLRCALWTEAEELGGCGTPRPPALVTASAQSPQEVELGPSAAVLYLSDTPTAESNPAPGGPVGDSP